MYSNYSVTVRSFLSCNTLPNGPSLQKISIVINSFMPPESLLTLGDPIFHSFFISVAIFNKIFSVLISSVYAKQYNFWTCTKLRLIHLYMMKTEWSKNNKNFYLSNYLLFWLQIFIFKFYY